MKKHVNEKSAAFASANQPFVAVDIMTILLSLTSAVIPLRFRVQLSVVSPGSGVRGLACLVAV